MVTHLHLRLLCPSFCEGWGYFGSNYWASKLSGCLISCSLEMVFTGNKPDRKEATAVWSSRSLQPVVQFALQQLVVSGQKAGVETIRRVCFPPFPPALLCLRQLVWFHIYYFPCRKMTPTQNRIRELGKGRVNLIIGQTNILSPRSLGFGCHFWCLLSINGIWLACVPFHLIRWHLLYSCVVALVYRFQILMD